MAAPIVRSREGTVDVGHIRVPVIVIDSHGRRWRVMQDIDEHANELDFIKYLGARYQLETRREAKCQYSRAKTFRSICY